MQSASPRTNSDEEGMDRSITSSPFFMDRYVLTLSVLRLLSSIVLHQSQLADRSQFSLFMAEKMTTNEI